MKNRFMISTVMFLCVLLLAGCVRQKERETKTPVDNGKLSVVTSFYPMYDFAKKIAGTNAEITVMVPAGTEVHDWEPSVSDLARLEQADLFIYSGAGMEPWAEDILESLENPKLIAVEASQGVSLMNEEERQEENQEEEHHHHGSYDPHVWLDPQNAKIEMKNIMEAFISADPENQTYYEENYQNYAEKLDELDRKFEETFAGIENKHIVVAHEAFGYLCRAYGLEQVGIEGLSADSEPVPSRMVEIIEFIRKNNVKCIFFETLSTSKVVDTIAAETGVKTEVLNPFEGVEQEDQEKGMDYFSVMEQNRHVLEEALK